MADLPGPKDVRCPVCEAEAGQECSGDVPPDGLHASRIERAIYARQAAREKDDERAR